MGDDADDLGGRVASVHQHRWLVASGLVVTLLGAVNLVAVVGGRGSAVWPALWIACLVVGPAQMWTVLQPIGVLYRDGLVAGAHPLRRRQRRRWQDVVLSGAPGRRVLRTRVDDEVVMALEGHLVRDSDGRTLGWREGWRLVRDTALVGGAADRTSTSVDTSDGASA